MTPHWQPATTTDSASCGAETNQWIRFPTILPCYDGNETPFRTECCHPSSRTSDLCSLLPSRPFCSSRTVEDDVVLVFFVFVGVDAHRGVADDAARDPHP